MFQNRFQTCKKSERMDNSLHLAARKGDYDQCWKLLQEGALVNARDHAGWTPLHEACYQGHFKIASLLIRYYYQSFFISVWKFFFSTFRDQSETIKVSYDKDPRSR